jgi:competence protein ComEC
MLGVAVTGQLTEGPELRGKHAGVGVVMSRSGRAATILMHSTDGNLDQGRVRALFEQRAPDAGSTVAFFGHWRRPWRSVLPGGWDSAMELRGAKINSVVRVDRYVADTPDRWLSVSSEPFTFSDYSGLLVALTTGDTSGVSEGDNELLKRTGTRHLLAISGLHIGMMAWLFGGTMALIIRPVSLIWPYGGLRLPSAVCAVLAALAYGQLAGWPVSAQRAVVGVSLVSLASVGFHKIRIWNLFGLAIGAVSLVSPESVRTIGFLLSFGSVLGILAITPRLTRLISPDLPTLVKWVLKSLFVSVGAWFGTLPVLAWVFQEVPLSSFVANIVAVPLVGFVVVPCALMGSLGFSPAVAVANAGLELLFRWLVLVDWGVSHPSVTPFGALLIAIAVAIAPLWRRLLWPALACSMSLLWFATAYRPPAPEGVLRVTFLDVGQGDSALVQGDQTVLVDGGRGRRDVVHYLRREGVIAIDEVVLTHPHQDHYGGLFAVIGELTVGALRVPRPPRPDEQEYSELFQLAALRGVRVLYPWDPAPDDMEILHPISPEQVGDLSVNDASIVFALSRGSSTVLFTGDVERFAEGLFGDLLSHVSVLKVAHHGSRSSSSVDFLNSVSPSLAVISCGDDNQFNHPSRRVLSRLSTAVVHRTDQHGTLQFQTDGATEMVRSWRPAIGWSAWRELRTSSSLQSPLLQLTAR